MSHFSVKEYLSLKMPTEEAAISDHQRILLALNTLGYENVSIPLSVLRTLYPKCRDANFDITVTLVHREHDWVVTQVEAGDQRHHHYGLAVDYGSTTIVMQLLDLTRGTVVGEEKVVNGQVTYGTDILTRILMAFLTGVYLKTGNVPNGEGFFCCASQFDTGIPDEFQGKDSLFGHVDGFQIAPDIPYNRKAEQGYESRNCRRRCRWRNRCSQNTKIGRAGRDRGL